MPTRLTRNYSNRTVDLLIQQRVTAAGKAQTPLSFGVGGSVCAGVQKVAQQFLVLFLTKRGSRALDPALGSTFMTDLEQGRIQALEDIPAFFNTAVTGIYEYISRTRPSGPPDERLAEAVLESWDIQPNRLILQVRLVTQAGAGREILLPVEVAIR